MMLHVIHVLSTFDCSFNSLLNDIFAEENMVLVLFSSVIKEMRRLFCAFLFKKLIEKKSISLEFTKSLEY